jgi:hypothetical protein
MIVIGVKMKTKKLFEKAMKEVKKLGERMLKFGESEKILYRQEYGLDESGHPIKGFNKETGEIKIPRKRKKKQKMNKLIIRRVKRIKKKERIKSERGRSSNYMVVDINPTAGLELNTFIIVDAFKKIFGDKFDEKTNILSHKDKKLQVKLNISKPTTVNPNGLFFIDVIDGDKKCKFYTRQNKIYMSLIVNFEKYLK